MSGLYCQLISIILNCDPDRRAIVRFAPWWYDSFLLHMAVMKIYRILRCVWKWITPFLSYFLNTWIRIMFFLTNMKVLPDACMVLWYETVSTCKYCIYCTDCYLYCTWAQVEWWLEHGYGWLIKRQWAGSVLGWVACDEYQVLGSTSIPARLDTLVYWESFSWLTSVGTTRNTVIRLGWSRIRLAVLFLHAAGAGLIGRPVVISGRYNKCHSLQLQNHYAHFPPLQHTHTHACKTQLCGTGHGKWS